MLDKFQSVFVLQIFWGFSLTVFGATILLVLAPLRPAKYPPLPWLIASPDFQRMNDILSAGLFTLNPPYVDHFRPPFSL